MPRDQIVKRGLGLITLLTVQQIAEETLPPGFCQDPGSGNKRRVMAGVLLMAASQHSPPITDFILFKGNNRLFHVLRIKPGYKKVGGGNEQKETNQSG